MPVLHIGWVDKLVASLTRFTPTARRQLHIEACAEQEDNNDNSSAMTPQSYHNHHSFLQTSATPALAGHHSSALTAGATPRPLMTRSSAIRGTAPSPLPLVLEEVDHSVRNGALTVILPQQSCGSTTSSSAPSMVTPLPSGGGGGCQSNLSAVGRKAPLDSTGE